MAPKVTLCPVSRDLPTDFVPLMGHISHGLTLKIINGFIVFISVITPSSTSVVFHHVPNDFFSCLLVLPLHASSEFKQ